MFDEFLYLCEGNLCCLTVIVKESFGLLVGGGWDASSYEDVDDGYQEDDQQTDLGLKRQDQQVSLGYKVMKLEDSYKVTPFLSNS